jgi:hypothetical protein
MMTMTCLFDVFFLVCSDDPGGFVLDVVDIVVLSDASTG